MPHPSRDPALLNAMLHCPRQPDRTTLRCASSPSRRYGTSCARSSPSRSEPFISRGNILFNQDHSQRIFLSRPHQNNRLVAQHHRFAKLESWPSRCCAPEIILTRHPLNANGEPTTAGIMKWARRSEDEHPLPHAYMGDLLRFHRADVDVWAREEADRRRVQNEQRRLRIA